MNNFKGVLSKVLIMLLLAETIVFSFSGCSGGTKEKNGETDSKVTSEPASQNGNLVSSSDTEKSSSADVVKTAEAAAKPTSESTGGESIKTIEDVDSESALKLATGLLLGIAEGGIIPTEQPIVVVVKPGDKTCTIGSYDILKKIKLTEVPKINVIDSKNAAWRITFTFKPEITVEAIDNVDKPEKVVKLYPKEGI